MHFFSVYTLNQYRNYIIKITIFKQKSSKKQEVLVNGEVCTMRGKKIRPGDLVIFNGRTYTVAYET